MCCVYFVSADSVLNNQSKESNWLQWDLDQVLNDWIRKFLLLKVHNKSFLLNSLVALCTTPASLTKVVLGTWLKQRENNNRQHFHSWHWNMLFCMGKNNTEEDNTAFLRACIYVFRSTSKLSLQEYALMQYSQYFIYNVNIQTYFCHIWYREEKLKMDLLFSP